jgi:hypothetical protein
MKMSELRNIRAAVIKASADAKAAAVKNPKLTEAQRKAIRMASFAASTKASVGFRKPSR